MNLNSLLDDDLEQPSDEPQETSDIGLESVLTDYVQLAETMSADPAEDVELQDAIVAFENAMYGMDALAELGRGMVASGSVCRMIANEARGIYPAFDGDTTLKLYTELPTGTRLRQATEEFSKGILALIAAASAAILAIVWKTLNWIFGGKKDATPPDNLKASDINKMVNDAPKASDDIKFDKELAKAAGEVADEMVEAANDGERLVTKNSKLGWYVMAGENKLEIHSTQDYFAAFMVFLRHYGKSPEDFLLRSPLSVSLHFDMKFHVALAQAAKQLVDISYQILADAKDNRKVIMNLMSDSDNMQGVSKDVAAQIHSEDVKKKEYEPDLGVMKRTSLNEYPMMLLGRRQSAGDALATLQGLRSEAKTSNTLKITSIEQVRRLIREATGSHPLGYTNSLFEQRDELAKVLAETSQIIEDLQSLSDPSFKPSQVRYTMTDKTRALVKPELAKLQSVVRALTDISLLIQRELEDWRRDLWKAVGVCERYGDFLGRIKPQADADGKYDQDAVLEWGEIQKKFNENTVKHMAEVNSMLSNKRYQTFTRVAKSMLKGMGF